MGIPRRRRSPLAVLTRGWHRGRRPMVTGNPWGILQSRRELFVVLSRILLTWSDLLLGSEPRAFVAESQASYVELDEFVPAKNLRYRHRGATVTRGIVDGGKFCGFEGS